MTFNSFLIPGCNADQDVLKLWLEKKITLALIWQDLLGRVMTDQGVPINPIKINFFYIFHQFDKQQNLLDTITNTWLLNVVQIKEIKPYTDQENWYQYWYMCFYQYEGGGCYNQINFKIEIPLDINKQPINSPFLFAFSFPISLPKRIFVFPLAPVPGSPWLWLAQAAQLGKRRSCHFTTWTLLHHN